MTAMISDAAIIVFVRNPEHGKVKTRLAATIGDANALKVYRVLLQHTYIVVKDIDCDKYIFYAESINDDDLWHGQNFFKKQQQGEDLGARMNNAFDEVLKIGYEAVIIIGSDCYELTPEIIRESLLLLQSNEVVIGPALDGGYYLLGMKRLHSRLFDNKAWSSAAVFADTTYDLLQEGTTFAILNSLNDVDEERDITFSY